MSNTEPGHSKFLERDIDSLAEHIADSIRVSLYRVGPSHYDDLFIGVAKKLGATLGDISVIQLNDALRDITPVSEAKITNAAWERILTERQNNRLTYGQTF